MLPEVRQLRYFALLAEERHFGRAAQRAGITQSAISQQIHRLEDVIGVRLVERGKRGASLTPAGEALLTYVHAVIDRVEEAVAAVRLAAVGGLNKLDIGVSPIALHTPMSRILQTFVKRCPDVSITLHEHWSERLMQDLLAARLDLAFMVAYGDIPGVRTVEVARDRFLLCIPEDHPLAKCEIVQLRDLRGQPLIFVPESHSPRMHRAFVAACRAEHFEPQVVHEAIEFPKVMALAAAGIGIGFTSEALAGMAPAGVALRPVGPPLEGSRLVLAWKEPIAKPRAAELIALAESIVGTRVVSAT